MGPASLAALAPLSEEVAGKWVSVHPPFQKFICLRQWCRCQLVVGLGEGPAACGGQISVEQEITRRCCSSPSVQQQRGLRYPREAQSAGQDTGPRQPLVPRCARCFLTLTGKSHLCFLCHCRSQNTPKVGPWVTGSIRKEDKNKNHQARSQCRMASQKVAGSPSWHPRNLLGEFLLLVCTLR